MAVGLLEAHGAPRYGQFVPIEEFPYHPLDGRSSRRPRGAGQVRSALAELCQAYWYPLYSFVRRRGYTPHDAEDLIQAFFVQLLEKRGLGRVDPKLGRFRTFLLASLKNFLANDWDKNHGAKAWRR